jgi:hypothetical protein
MISKEQRIEAMKGVLASLFASQRTLKSLAPQFSRTSHRSCDASGTDRWRHPGRVLFQPSDDLLFKLLLCTVCLLGGRTEL